MSGTAEPDWEDPRVEAAWLDEQREVAEHYLRAQRVPFGAIEPRASWFVVPIVAFWRGLGARSSRELGRAGRLLVRTRVRLGFDPVIAGAVMPAAVANH